MAGNRSSCRWRTEQDVSLVCSVQVEVYLVSTMPSVSRNQPWPGGRGVSKGTAGGRHKAGGGTLNDADWPVVSSRVLAVNGLA